jgi:hypothetical protein
MILAGHRPEIIMEIATRALSFWTYQVLLTFTESLLLYVLPEGASLNARRNFFLHISVLFINFSLFWFPDISRAYLSGVCCEQFKRKDITDGEVLWTDYLKSTNRDFMYPFSVVKLIEREWFYEKTNMNDRSMIALFFDNNVKKLLKIK